MSHVTSSLAISNRSSIGRLDHIDVSCYLLFSNASVVEGRDPLDFIFKVPEFEFVALCLVVEDIAAAKFEFGLLSSVQDYHRRKFGSVDN